MFDKKNNEQFNPSLITPKQVDDNIASNVSSARPAISTIDDRLCAKVNIDSKTLAQAKSLRQKQPRKKLGQILLEMDAISEDVLQECLAEQYDLPFLDLNIEIVNPNAMAILDKAFIEQHNALPFDIKDGWLLLAMTDPTDIFLQDEIQRKAGKPLKIFVCTEKSIKEILALSNKDNNEQNLQVDSIIEDMDAEEVEVVETEEEDLADLEEAAGDSPIIKFVNYLIVNAIREGASDIHIEPGDKKLKVRYRIDGILFEIISPPHTMLGAVTSRIKIMSNLDIAERRVPQDGRMRVVIDNRNIDMRVSTLPTVHGEKVVMRVLDGASAARTLNDLDMDEDTNIILANNIQRPHGIILVTGPTGSGKSTTLYAVLRSLDRAKMNISTVEDPVEYQLDGINQVQVHDKIGMSFAAALRSLLRQDPDVVMVGEIRDQETARIAIQASLTGHLVLSTLHTNDAPSSITRLINIGIEPFLISASLNAVLAQRLVRRICTDCKSEIELPAEQNMFLQAHGYNVEKAYAGAGCDKCRHTGYQGRIGIYELLAIDDVYRDIITGNPTVIEMRRLCNERGMVSLRGSGFRLVKNGITTVEEVMRVTVDAI